MTETAVKEPRIEIRASGLPGAGDCFRRWAYSAATDLANAKTLLPIFQKHGFDIVRRKRENIGAAIGTSCHEGFGAFFQAKIDGYTLNPSDVALAKFGRMDHNLIDFDEKVTPNKDVAMTQVERMVKAYLPHAETLKPKRVEFKLETRLDEIKPYWMTGHPDIYEVTEDIRDMKFGRKLSQYEAQVGGYSLMGRSNGMGINRLFVDWVARATKTKTQPELQVVEYDRVKSETAAYYVSHDLMRMLETFTETGNEWIFPYNNSSNLCSKKWCPAHSTPFCTMGKPGKEDEE